jgi:hypothetical protein
MLPGKGGPPTVEHPRNHVTPSPPSDAGDGCTSGDLVLATRYLQAYRSADDDTMARISAGRDDRITAALSVFAASVVPVVREVVGDEAYVRAMEGLAESDMAATLSFLIGLTAAFTHRDADETFLHFADLVNYR